MTLSVYLSSLYGVLTVQPHPPHRPGVEIATQTVETAESVNYTRTP